MVKYLLVFSLVSVLALPAHAGGMPAAGLGTKLLGQKLSMQSVKRGLAGFLVAACLGLSGCAWNTPSTSRSSSDNPQMVVYANQSEGDLSNTANAHRDIHSEVFNLGSHPMNRSEVSKFDFDEYGSGSLEVESNHGHMFFSGGIEWHGHKYESGMLADLHDSSMLRGLEHGGGYVYGLRYWNIDLYLDNLANMGGSSLSSVLFTYVVDGVVLVGIGEGAPYKAACPDYSRDETLAHVERLGTLTIGAPRPGWAERIAVADVSGVLFTHHPDYEQDRHVSFAEQSMQSLVEDWLAMQDEAIQQAYHQSVGEVIFRGERLGIFTDGERLIEVTEMEFAGRDSHTLQSFPVLVQGDNLYTNY